MLTRSATAAACTLALYAPPAAAQGPGGSTYDADRAGTGGAEAGRSVPRTPRTHPRAELKHLRLTTTPLAAGGPRGRVRFMVAGAPLASSRVDLLDGRRLLRRTDTGAVRRGRWHHVWVDPAGLPADRQLTVRVSGTDRRGRWMRRPARYDQVQVTVIGQLFPVRGPWRFGDGFGGDRGTHAHQGQDITAAEGTPLVAPQAGTVSRVAFQRGGAGHYVVLDADGQDTAYVFMHLRAGSVVVSEGQRTVAGQRLGQVGSTGRSSGPHLHFELWTGGWARGRAVDPAPTLRAWAQRDG